MDSALQEDHVTNPSWCSRLLRQIAPAGDDLPNVPPALLAPAKQFLKTTWIIIAELTKWIFLILAGVILLWLAINAAEKLWRVSEAMQFRIDMLRDRYDDFALSHAVMMDMERFAGRVREHVRVAYISLRWNRATDEVSRAKRTLGLWFENVVRHFWWMLLLGLSVAGTLNHVRGCGGLVAVPGELPLPAWMLEPRKSDGSSSHSRPGIAEPEPVSPNLGLPHHGATVEARGLEDPAPALVTDAHGGSAAQTVPVATETRRTLAATAPVMEGASSPLSLPSPTGFETLLKAGATARAAGAQGASLRDQASRATRKTAVGGLVWCEVCRQVHCCEVPY